MFVDASILFMLVFFAIGMTWSSIARGRTIRCLKGCYYDFLTQATAVDHVTSNNAHVDHLRSVSLEYGGARCRLKVAGVGARAFPGQD